MTYTHRVNGEALRRWRILRGYSIRVLAEKAALDKNTVWQLENGRSGMISSIAAIADALSAPMSELLYDDEEVA